MKLLLLSCAILIASSSAHAQVASGNKFINGTANLSLIEVAGSTQTVTTVSPTLGYFISDRMAVGTTLSITSQSFESFDNGLTVSLSPFVKRFFPIANDKFYFSLEGTLLLSYGNSVAGFGDFNSSEDAFSIGISMSPGFVYFPVERWSLDFSFAGFGLSFFNIGENTVTLFNLGVTTFSPSLGFSYYF